MEAISRVFTIGHWVLPHFTDEKPGSSVEATCLRVITEPDLRPGLNNA